MPYEDAIKCGAGMFIFLGDYVSDLSEHQRTMDLVYEIRSKYPMHILFQIFIVHLRIRYATKSGMRETVMLESTLP